MKSSPTNELNGMQWSLLQQFDIDDGLCVRAPMDERELKKQLPLQALLEEEQGPNDPMVGIVGLEIFFSFKVLLLNSVSIGDVFGHANFLASGHQLWFAILNVAIVAI